MDIGTALRSARASGFRGWIKKMNYATEAQKSLIRHLSGTTVEAAAQSYGFAPGAILTIRGASEIIDSLKIAADPARAAAQAKADRDARAFEKYLAAMIASKQAGQPYRPLAEFEAEEV